MVIVAVTLAASVNRQLIGLIGQPVKEAFGLSDTQVGGLMSITGILAALASPLLGQMSDTFDRHRMLVASIVIWSIATAAYGIAATYAGLIASLVVLASAESTLVPICNSLIADHFKGGARINANLVYFAAGGLTTGVGSFVGGQLLGWSGGHLDALLPFWPGATDWRVAMAITAIIGAPLAVMALTMGRDRHRQASGARTDLTQLRIYLRNHWKTLVSFNAANAGYFIASTTVMGWMPIYIVRHFGISPAELGMRLGVAIGIADIAGILFGLLAIKKLYQYLGPIAPRYIFQASLAVIGLVNVLQLAASSVTMVLFLLSLQNFLATFGTASFNNMVQDMSGPAIRGKIFGINSLVVGVVGIPGPLLVGMLSDRLQQASSGMLLAIVSISTPFLLLSILIYALTNSQFLNTIRQVADEERQAVAA
ncbi:MAG: hypothetical protein RLZZ08_1968 [Pseudomonadota bacterium]